MIKLFRKIRCIIRGYHTRAKYEFVQVETDAVIPLSVCLCDAYMIHPKRKDRNPEYRSTWGTSY